MTSVYLGPNTSRERHPLFMDPAGWHNGMRELIAVLGAQLATRPSDWLLNPP